MMGFKLAGLPLVPLGAFFLISLADSAPAIGSTGNGAGLFSTFKPKRSGNGNGNAFGRSGGSGGAKVMQEQPSGANASSSRTLMGNQIQRNSANNGPSNGDLLMQYLTKRANQQGKTAQEFVENLVSKKGAQPVQPTSRSITLAEADPELVEVVTQESCNEVPSLSEYDCVQKELRQTSYSCSLNHFPDVCQVVTESMNTMCPRVVERTLTYECPQLRNQQLCYSVPQTVQTTCTGFVNQVQQSDCERTRTQKACNIMEVDVPWTCLDTENVVQQYTCDKIDSQVECLPNVVAIDDECTREVNVPVVYEYYDVETTTKCETIQVVNEACTMATFSLTVPAAGDVLVQQPCTESYFDTECTTVDVMVDTLCDVTSTIVEEYPCEQREMKTFKKACGFGQGKQYFMLEQQTNGNGNGIGNGVGIGIANGNGNGNGNGYVNANGTGSGTSLGRGCTYEAPVTVMGTCTREVIVTNQQPCQEAQQQEQCNVVEKTYEVTCPTTTTTVETEVIQGMNAQNCPQFIDQEVCTDVNNPVQKTGVRYEKRTERYPCTSTSANEVCVQLQVLGSDTCSVQLQQTTEIPCMRRRKKQVCQDMPVTNVEVCADIGEQEIQYPCDQITYEEKCSTVPFYEMGQCETTLTETVLEPCQSDYQVTQCTAADEPQMGTCFNDEEVEVSQTCFKVEYNTTCNIVQTTKLMENALQTTAAGKAAVV